MSVKAFIAAMTLKVKVIVVCAAVAVTSAAAVAVGVAVTKEDTYRVLKVFEMTGKAVVEREGSGELDAYVGMNLESGDILTVGSESTLRISMDGDKYVLLDSDTVLELIAAGSPSDSRTAINLKKGTILNEITTPLSANSSYEVSTPKATMAVRGTSFSVSVEADSEGGYIIRENTFDGKVEVTLIDSEGNATDQTAFVTADKGVTIRTVPDSSSGNPAEIDGTSSFVFEDENGEISELEEGANPVHDIRYQTISAAVKENALRSNDEDIMILSDDIVRKLKGEAPVSEDSNETSVSETDKTEASSDISSDPDTVLSETDISSEVTEPVQTSVPETAESSGGGSETAVPEAVTEAYTEVCESIPEEEFSETVSAESEDITNEVHSEERENGSNDQTTAESERESRETTVTFPSVTTLPATNTYHTTFTTPYTGSTGPTGTTGSSASVTSATMPSITSSVTSQTTATEPEKKTFEVRFMCEGTLIAAITVEKGNTVSDIPEVPEKTGYTGKWMYSGIEFTSATAVTSDMTVTAAYTAETFTVTFKAAGSADITRTVSYGKTVTNIPDVPEKTGYTGKWVCGGSEFTSSTVVTSDITVTAVYTAKTFTVTFKAEGSADITRTVSYGKTVTNIPNVPEKTGYTGKWICGGSEFTSSTAVTSDMTVTAVYTAKTFTVTFKAAGSADITRTVSYGKTVTNIPDVPEKTGYTGKWMYSGIEFTSATAVTSDMTVTAAYTAETFAVTFVPSYDPTAVLETLSISYGSKPSYAPEEAVDTDSDGNYDYYLWGWEDVVIPTVTEDTEITIPYTDYNSIHEVMVIDKGNTLIHKLYKEGDTLIMPSPESTPDEGYEFKGWGTVSSGEYNSGKKKGTESNIVTLSDSYSASGNHQPGDSVTLTSSLANPSASPSCAGNIAFKAIYDPISYTLIYYDEAGTTQSYTIYYGQNIANNVYSPPEGYYLAYDSSGSSPVGADDICTGDVTVYAVAKDVTVTFTYNGTTYNTITMKAGQTLTVSAGHLTGTNAPFSTEDDYTNSGETWMFTGSDGNTYSIGDVITLSGDLTLEAIKSSP